MALPDELAAYGGRVTVFARDEDGRADLHLLAADAVAAGAAIYACGPERMTTTLEQIGEESGAGVVIERFAAGEAHRQDDRPFTVVLEKSLLTVDVPADRTVLEVFEEKGVAIPNVCREGNCGSCETRVLAGAIDHRDVLLTPRQRKANDRMMICVSRAESPSLTLDL